MKETIKITGMHCKSCSALIKSHFPPVSSLVVDHEQRHRVENEGPRKSTRARGASCHQSLTGGGRFSIDDVLSDENVKVTFDDDLADIEYDESRISKDRIVKLIKENGYGVSR